MTSESNTEQEIHFLLRLLSIHEEYNRQNFGSGGEMESPQPVANTPARGNRTLYTILAVILILFCCCVVLIAAGYYYYRQNILTIPVEPTEESTPGVSPTSASVSPSAPSGEIGQAPEGGLGNDILRNDTWQYVAAAAQGRGCDEPMGADTKIEVLQQPQNGVWVEQWNVACASGNSYPFEITFMIDATGATFDIKSLP
jgi:hypothetical protein